MCSNENYEAKSLKVRDAKGSTKCVFICLKLFLDEDGHGGDGRAPTNPVTRYLFHIVLFQIICSGLVPLYI